MICKNLACDSKKISSSTCYARASFRVLHEGRDLPSKENVNWACSGKFLQMQNCYMQENVVENSEMLDSTRVYCSGKSAIINKYKNMSQACVLKS